MDTEYTTGTHSISGVVGIFGEGAGQNYLSDEGGGSNALILDYAVVIKPIQQINLKAGVIGYQMNPLFTTMSPSTSLGAEEKFELATPSETLNLRCKVTKLFPLWA